MKIDFIELKYKENGIPYILAIDALKRHYRFTSHSLEQLINRSKIVKTFDDLIVPARRIIKALNHFRVARFIYKFPPGLKIIVHDTDIKMCYVITKNKQLYKIVTVFNESSNKFGNLYFNAPEVWVSINNTTQYYKYRTEKES